ncbi:Putative SAC domain, inositol phosphatase, hSac2 domain-containing protein [Septoria linicola]|uniref:SAC domain, inositol phosphatase, hSac2 domain-containing protein n=1 Tax=Septoria linicola TaxID=215465 RepID=A0A9Q9EFB8_9PEZI|nr:putative SAC domain, inositol phosphatase, hSac2 domain-containing protein [Septoria linicola]USW49621.1 Putative SAC domain, inositol phosphatase, hSac2 domain-containing protein [Septoria linicola]
MSGLARKLLICAAVDGLFIQSAHQQRGTRIEYGNNRITAVSEKDDVFEGSLLEAHGVVGLLNLVSSSYLIAVTKREQVAQIREKPVYRITDVTLIPLSDRSSAATAITNAQVQLKQNASAGDETDDSDVGEDAGTEPGDQTEHQHPSDEAKALEPPQPGTGTSFVKDVVQNKGKFGRFATSWFSKSNRQTSTQPFEELTSEQKRSESHALPGADKKSAHESSDPQEEPKGRTSTEKRRQSAIEYLTPRIIKSTRLYFSSSGFYFSYDHDLSRALGTASTMSPSVPLWKRFDSLFFWNRHLAKPIIDAGEDTLVLPLMQGFVGQRDFSIAEQSDQAMVAEAEGTELTDFAQKAAAVEAPAKMDFLLTLISRRSVKRAGLRYLRRGIDDQGNVGNSVETEQILSAQGSDNAQTHKAYSLLQYRGSMPLFFSQSPYSFKPAPVLFGSDATNQAAFKKHFEFLSSRYGNVAAVSLVDKHGTEVKIGSAYEAAAKSFNESGGISAQTPLRFEWFDFHGECKGMKFENIQILMDTMSGFLEASGCTVLQDGKVEQMQQGVMRTNCMDCLDRTNVTQAAAGSLALTSQLQNLGLSIDLKSDPKTQWFNTLWADNGDAISKQYAGTSALKGDFTRTRKRNWTGALSDFSLTLNRYYNNIFGDYFLQTNIDYFLGASPIVFEEFETDMQTQDYALDMNVIRQNAIDTCIKIVLADPDEELVSAWTLSCPRMSNTLRSLPFEECVLLLTEKALYFCRFDWDTDKVGSFERVDLLDIREIWRGPYVTSALGPSHVDETKNYGFAIRYTNQGPSTVRTNTRSLSVGQGSTKNVPDSDAKVENIVRKGMQDDSNRRIHSSPGIGETRVLAFKALPPKRHEESTKQTDAAKMKEVEAVKSMTGALERALRKASEQDSGPDFDESKDALEVQEHDIISAAEAKKSTSYVESLGYSLKKLVWA